LESKGGCSRHERIERDHDLGGQSITPCGLLEIESAQLFITFVEGPVTAHSKYNIIERCWGTLERHWNGTQLKTIHDAVKWASSMTWKSVNPIVEFLDKVYCNGVTLTRQAFQILNQVLERQAGIEKWSVIIKPQLSNSAP